MIRIGNASGFWGDDPQALKRQLKGGGLDYVVADYLAEVSMSILKKQHLKNPEKGYVADFVEHVLNASEELKKTSTRIITNAGGLQPYNCAKAIQKVFKEKGMQVSIAVVEGDDLIDQLDELIELGNDFKNFETEESFQPIKDKIQSANPYFGVLPLLEVLKSDAQIILTGRVTDSALTIAPLIHEYEWELDDWDRIASGMIAGHAIECGAQICGGNFTDWDLVESWKDIGFPIVEVLENGDFYVTKHSDSGGMISVNTVKEQLLYEVSDPASYYSPDVISDLTQTTVTQVEKDRVLVSNIKGKMPTSLMKVSMSYQDGFRAVGDILVSGGDMVAKAKVFEEILWTSLNESYERSNSELIGVNATKFENHNSKDGEMLLRFYVHDSDRKKVEKFTKYISSIILKGPQGVAVTGGRPRVQEIMAYWPTFVKKENVSLNTFVLTKEGDKTLEKEVNLKQDWIETNEETKSITSLLPKEVSCSNKLVRVNLREVCLARSGDKGNSTNLAVIPRSETLFFYLDKVLTAQYIQNLTQRICKGEVLKYQVEGMQAFNFLLQNSLDGGGTRSLRIDAQGKTLAAVFLDHEIEIPKELIPSK